MGGGALGTGGDAAAAATGAAGGSAGTTTDVVPSAAGACVGGSSARPRDAQAMATVAEMATKRGVRMANSVTQSTCRRQSRSRQRSGFQTQIRGTCFFIEAPDAHEEHVFFHASPRRNIWGDCFFIQAPRREPGDGPGRFRCGCRIIPLLAHGGFYCMGPASAKATAAGMAAAACAGDLGSPRMRKPAGAMDGPAGAPFSSPRRGTDPGSSARGPRPADARRTRESAAGGDAALRRVVGPA